MQRRTWTPPGPILSALAILLVLHGCGSENRITEIEGTSNVTLSLNGLQTLGEGLNYQAWLVHQSGSNIYGFPLVLFNINGEGQMVDPVADTILGGPFHSDLAASAVLGVAISLEMTEVLVAYSSYTLRSQWRGDAGHSGSVRTRLARTQPGFFERGRPVHPRDTNRRRAG